MLVKHWKSARACFCGGTGAVVAEDTRTPSAPWCILCLRSELMLSGLKFAMRRMHIVVDGKLMHDTATVAEILERHGPA